MVNDPTARQLADLRVALAALRAAIPIVEYVSRGRGFVDVEPYPDAAARTVLGVIDAHIELGDDAS